MSGHVPAHGRQCLCTLDALCACLDMCRLQAVNAFAHLTHCVHVCACAGSKPSMPLQHDKLCEQLCMCRFQALNVCTLDSLCACPRMCRFQAANAFAHWTHCVHVFACAGSKPSMPLHNWRIVCMSAHVPAPSRQCLCTLDTVCACLRMCRFQAVSAFTHLMHSMQVFACAGSKPSMPSHT